MKRIFIMGCHRSGTTMMRLILDSHPKIHCFDEWKGYSALETGDYSNSKNADILGFKLPNWTEYLIDSEYYAKIYQNDPIIFMLRDVRAVVASMLTLPTGDGVWFNGAVRAIDDRWQTNPHTKFKEKFADELEKIKGCSEIECRKAALFWKYKTSCYIDMIRKGWPVFPVRYEHFVQKPKPWLKIMTKFLEVPWDNSLVNHNFFDHDETFDGVAVGDTLTSRPIDKMSIFKWETVLNDSQEQAILETAGDLNDFVSILGLATSKS